MSSTIDWTHLHPQYSGKWIALAQDETTVIASSVKFQTAINQANKKGTNQPIMFKVPQNPVAYVGSV